jgi:hypothetical protein
VGVACYRGCVAQVAVIVPRRNVGVVCHGDTSKGERSIGSCAFEISLALYYHETQFFVSQLFLVLTHISVSIFFYTDFRVADISAADTLFCVLTLFVTHSCC